MARVKLSSFFCWCTYLLSKRNFEDTRRDQPFCVHYFVDVIGVLLNLLLIELHVVKLLHLHAVMSAKPLFVYMYNYIVLPVL